MRFLTNYFCIVVFVILTSCSGNDEPDYPVVMQPASIATNDTKGNNQTFEYDDYGRIVAWTLKSSSSSYSAHYSYPNDNAIQIKSEEIWNEWYEYKREFEETIQLTNGRASKSEGTFMQSVSGVCELQKTYRMEFEYDPSNHLVIVKHAEVVGIGDNIPHNAWNKPWSWENYLIWDDGNLKEFQDYLGNTTVYQTTKYDYSIEAADYPIITPGVINCNHHHPLLIQSIFGQNSANFVKSISRFDHFGNLNFACQYHYELEQARVIEFTETITHNPEYLRSTTYKVNY